MLRAAPVAAAAASSGASLSGAEEGAPVQAPRGECKVREGRSCWKMGGTATRQRWRNAGDARGGGCTSRVTCTAGPGAWAIAHRCLGVVTAPESPLLWRETAAPGADVRARPRASSSSPSSPSCLRAVGRAALLSSSSTLPVLRPPTPHPSPMPRPAELTRAEDRHRHLPPLVRHPVAPPRGHRHRRRPRRHPGRQGRPLLRQGGRPRPPPQLGRFADQGRRGGE
jgi:hypothetical protein